MEKQSLYISSERDIFIALSLVKQTLKLAESPESSQQMVLVSVSELTRNVLDHAGQSGFITWEIIDNSICITVTDSGPGIRNLPDILDAVTPCTGAKGLGLGLSGTKRLMDEFSIESSERGTKVRVSKRNAAQPKVQRRRNHEPLGVHWANLCRNSA